MAQAAGQLLGAEGANDASGQFVVYRLLATDLPTAAAGQPPVELRKRFSAFVDLIQRLGKDASAAARGSTAAVTVDNWKRQLHAEKRAHTGKASRAPPVVQGRCALIQRMMDALTSVPELAHHPILLAFLNAH